MNAYYHFHAQEITQEAAALNQHRCAPRHLTPSQLEFLNPEACRAVNPYSRSFWPELVNWLTAASERVQDLPKAAGYRHTLEPYLFRRVHMTAGTWCFQDCGGGRVRLLLRDVRLTHVHDSIGAAPDTVVDHMNIWVSPAWLNRVAPACGGKLALDGVLYEYAGASKTRNIGVLPVLLMPEDRMCRGHWTSCAVRPALAA